MVVARMLGGGGGLNMLMKQHHHQLIRSLPQQNQGYQHCNILQCIPLLNGPLA
tara:strand:+ start:469 stop:627 length:159 start_codon:yes stop_codon:yes gene_type:complete